MIHSSEARQGRSFEGDVYCCGCCPRRSFLRQTFSKVLHPFLSLRPRLCFCLGKLLDQMEGVSKFGLNGLCVCVFVCVSGMDARGQPCCQAQSPPSLFWGWGIAFFMNLKVFSSSETISSQRPSCLHLSALGLQVQGL